MNKAPIFEWDEEAGVAFCTLTDGRKSYIGTAKCHPNDEDMKGEKTGCEIAFMRAKIEALKDYRDEIKHKIAALEQLYYSMKHSKYFNEKSYENKMLQKQIYLNKFDLMTTKEIIDAEKQNLKDYINEKDKFYLKTRARRKERAEKANLN